jgi:hypothetical protein
VDQSLYGRSNSCGWIGYRSLRRRPRAPRRGSGTHGREWDAGGALVSSQPPARAFPSHPPRGSIAPAKGGTFLTRRAPSFDNRLTFLARSRRPTRASRPFGRARRRGAKWRVPCFAR